LAAKGLWLLKGWSTHGVKVSKLINTYVPMSRCQFGDDVVEGEIVLVFKSPN
jgi:hypothetical protein